VAVGAVVHAVVADLVRGLDAVAAEAVTGALRVREVGEGELVVGVGGVALGLEDDDLVDLADLQVEIGGLGGVQGDAAALGAVDAAEVDGELLVDEDPDVVVPGEVELLSALVFEPVADLAREVEVLGVALVRRSRGRSGGRRCRH
jgi:hypothetical protein